MSQYCRGLFRPGACIFIHYTILTCAFVGESAVIGTKIDTTIHVQRNTGPCVDVH
ncbi:hypothetical protein BDZ94DRAFT_1259634, partial [Collybia nuda]